MVKKDTVSIFIDEMSLLNFELIWACRDKNFTLATKLLQQGADPNVRDKWWFDERTPLHYGCRYGRLEFVKLLIHDIETYKCNLEVRDSNQQTPLHYACRYGHLNIVQYLISERGCNPEVVDGYQRSPVDYAYYGGHLNIVQYFIKQVCGSNFRDISLLQLAFQKGHLEVVECFVKQKNINLKQTIDSFHQTPLHYACRDGHLHIVQYLISERGCNPEVRDSYQRTPLYYACVNGHLNVVQYLISEQGCNPEVRDSYQRTPLYYACVNGHLNVVQYLISEQGCNPEVRDRHQETPLHFTCQYGHLNIVHYLISEQGCDPEVKDKYQWTPLHYASRDGHLNIVQYLISEQGCNPEARDRYQNTPLYRACQYEHIKIVEFLIRQQNYNPDCIISACQHTLLHCACQYGHLNIVQYLISERGCNVDVQDKSGDTPLHCACQYNKLEVIKFLIVKGKCNPDLSNNDGDTPLHVSCRYDNLDVVEVLISEGKCNPDTSNQNGDTALHIACRGSYASASVVKYLLTEGNSSPIIWNRNGQTPLELASYSDQLTPLHYACQYGYLNIVQYLISEQDCNPEVRDSDQQTPLHYACRYGHLNIVQYLISVRGCNPEVRDRDQQTPLYLAYKEKYMEIVLFLIRHQNFNPDGVINSKQQTLLHCACQDGHLDIVKYLISERGCNPWPEVKDSYQWTPLYLAYQSKHIEIVQFLIRQQNFNPDCIINNKHQTSLHYACEEGHLDIVQYLISERGCNVNVHDKSGNTPLHCACQNDNVEVAKFLIIKGKCNPDLINNNQDTVLHIACQKEVTDLHTHMVKVLINEGKCNPREINKIGGTALHIAYRQNKVELVGILSCYNPNVVDKNGDTVLHIACKDSNLSVVKVIVRGQKCNLELTNNNPGDTALHIVCRKSSRLSLDVLKYLLANGYCNPNTKNKNGQTPLEVTTDPEMIRELIRHGANPTNVYETHRKVVGTKQPLQPPVKVFVVGNPSAGKSTLTAALKREKSLLARAFTPTKKVSGVDEKTAGVIPHDFKSKKCGRITLYDFAGQPEFYSSHAALLQNAVQTSPPVFLLVVDLSSKSKKESKRDTSSKNDKEINIQSEVAECVKKMEQIILYWLSFLENQCTSVSSKPHVIIVGSHADMLDVNKRTSVVTSLYKFINGLQMSKGEDLEQKLKFENSLQKSHQFSNLHLCNFIVLDCQYSESTGMSELRECLKKSCDSLRNQETININAHCFFVYLLDKFKDSTAVKINDIIPHIQSGKESASERQPLFFLPVNTPALFSLCDELNDRGHILFLKDPVSIENSWVVIDKAVLLSEVTGTIFAPEGFQQHCKLASSTGVVPVSNLTKSFPKHNSAMLVGFLSHLEFCHEITDEEVLQLASEQHQSSPEQITCSTKDQYLLFPALISLDVSNDVWDSTEFEHYCGWTLLSSQLDQFFTSRFLQVLLLRLAFTFAFPHKQDFPALLRKCSLWKNGIYWGNRDGVETLVEVVERNKAVIVLMRCPELTSEYLQLRSSVIQKVLAAASEFCGKVDTVELFIDPSEIIKYPLKPTSQLTLFSLTEIAEAVVTAKPAVVSATGRTLSMDKLLVFEPYALLGSKILYQLFSTEHSTITVTDRFLSQISDCIPERKDTQKDTLVKLFKSNHSILAQLSPEENIVHVLQMWKDGCEGTYQCLREKLDKWSIFAGRNPLELAGVSAHTIQVDLFTEEAVTQTQQGQLSLIDLNTVRKAVWDSRVKWYDLGVELGVSVDTLKVIKTNSHHEVDDCFTAMLEEWLKTNPTWSSLVEALKSPPVDYPQLAEEVFTNYINTTSTPLQY